MPAPWRAAARRLRTGRANRSSAGRRAGRPSPAAVPAAAPTAPIPGASPVASPSPLAAAAGTATNPDARYGGTLVVAANNDPGQFNPGITTASGTHTVTGSLYNGLIFLDDKLNPQPDLADSWTVSTGRENLHLQAASRGDLA